MTVAQAHLPRTAIGVRTAKIVGPPTVYISRRHPHPTRRLRRPRSRPRRPRSRLPRPLPQTPLRRTSCSRSLRTRTPRAPKRSSFTQMSQPSWTSPEAARRWISTISFIGNRLATKRAPSRPSTRPSEPLWTATCASRSRSRKAPTTCASVAGTRSLRTGTFTPRRSQLRARHHHLHRLRSCHRHHHLHHRLHLHLLFLARRLSRLLHRLDTAVLNGLSVLAVVTEA